MSKLYVGVLSVAIVATLIGTGFCLYKLVQNQKKATTDKDKTAMGIQMFLSVLTCVVIVLVLGGRVWYIMKPRLSERRVFTFTPTPEASKQHRFF